MADRRLAVEQVQSADKRWNAALDSSEFAPPNAGFGAQMREIADASEQEAGALRLADATGLGWNPAPGASRMRLSYELRPGGNRPGSPGLWSAFDEAVRRLGVAMEGVAVSAIARGFAQLAEAAHRLADEAEANVRVSGRRDAG